MKQVVFIRFWGFIHKISKSIEVVSIKLEIHT